MNPILRQRLAKALDRAYSAKVTDVELVETVELLRENYNRMCVRLHECVMRHRLGLGGEHVDDLVCDEVDRLRGSVR